MFKITDSKGFQMTFENGYTISVQFGTGNYCEKRYSQPPRTEKDQLIFQSKDAEIAIWDKYNKWCLSDFTDKGDGQVAGWLTADEVFEIMTKVQAYK